MSSQGESSDAMSAQGSQGGDVKRPRGVFKRVELRTIPESATVLQLDDTARQEYRTVSLLTNYVPMEAMPNRMIHMYRVDFAPEIESSSLMRFLFKSATATMFTSPPIYDGVHECRSGQKLTNDVTVAKVVDAKDGNEYEVKLTNTGTSVFGAEFIRTYNMHMNSFLRTLGFYSPQPGLFVNPKQFSRVGDDIMMLRGYRTSANLHDGNNMLMNLEASHKLVQRQNVLDLMMRIKSQPSRHSGSLPEVLRANLTGKLVVTSYNSRCYRIEDLDFQTKPTSTFERNGQPTTFVDYFQTVHNKTITDKDQPMLKVVPNNQRGREETTRVTLLVPELCNLAGLTNEQRNDGRLKMDLIRASQISPADRVKHMSEFLATFHNNADIKRQLNNWGYSYGNAPCRLTAHVLPPTGYAYKARDDGDMNRFSADENTANINVHGLAVKPRIEKMVIIFPKKLNNGFLKLLEKGFEKVGLSGIARPTTWPLNEDSMRDYTQALRSIPPDTTIAVVLMRNQNKMFYDAIKKLASVERGILTQVITAKLMEHPQRSVSASQKIALQVAAKVGGEPWWVDIPLKELMICGYDTYHDTAKRGRSYGAFVASLNQHFSRWWSKADAHERLEEISSQMSVNVMEAIKVYRKFNEGKSPSRIIIYRDGVGEGQLEHVFRIELSKILEALASLETKIALTMVIVNKRIGARFYLQSGPQGAFSNPTPGTVIDHVVTRKERFDFYLVSQSTRQGTVTPTYYNIIHDEAGFRPEIHQKLAFKLTLLYYNWSGTVRVPAPCQYAHKLALLCGEHLHNQPNAQLDDKLHYL